MRLLSLFLGLSAEQFDARSSQQAHNAQNVYGEWTRWIIGDPVSLHDRTDHTFASAHLPVVQRLGRRNLLQRTVV